MIEPTKGFRERLDNILTRLEDYRLKDESKWENSLTKGEAISAIQDLVLELIGDFEEVPPPADNGAVPEQLVMANMFAQEYTRGRNNLRQALRERVKE